MRLGIAGCGRIAERGYVPAALAAEGVTIAAFADPDADRLRQCVELWERESGEEARASPAPPSCCESEPIDLLVVAAPAAHHLALAEEAAAAGVPCLVEKPPAPDLAAAERLAALDPQPFLAFNRRFLQGAELRDAIPAEGWLELDLELRFRRGAWGAHEVRRRGPARRRHPPDRPRLPPQRQRPDRRAASGDRAGARHSRAGAEPRPRPHLAARPTAATARRSASATAPARSWRARAWGGIGARLARLLGRPDPLVLSLQRQLEALRD